MTLFKIFVLAMLASFWAGNVVAADNLPRPADFFSAGAEASVPDRAAEAVYTGATGAESVAAGYSKYNFTFHYTGDSGDYYEGYVYAPDGMCFVGQHLENQPAEMGETPLGGYYDITAETAGFRT